MITTTGSVRGAGSDGIRAYGNNGNTTIAAANVYGKYNGVNARVDNGVLSITTTGIVTGANGDGVYARDYGASGGITIHTTGPVTGSQDGVYARLGKYREVGGPLRRPSPAGPTRRSRSRSRARPRARRAPAYTSSTMG